MRDFVTRESGTRPTPPDPQTPEQWQEATTLAYGALAVESARIFGLISGGATVEVERCAEILTRGRDLGYDPDERLGVLAILNESGYDEADAERLVRVVTVSTRELLAGADIAQIVPFLARTS